MANDKHFRVKNGVKVGSTEVITNSAKVVASTIEVANVILPTKISNIETTLSSLSAALGTYTDSLVTSSLIGDLKLTASAAASTAVTHRQSASASRSAALSAKNDAVTFRGNALNAKNNTDDHASDALAAKTLAEAYRLDACAHEAAAQSSKSDANAALLLSQSSRDAAILSLSSAKSSKRAADDARSDALVAKLLAEQEKLTTSGHASDANVALILAQSHRDNANLSKSAASVARVAAEAFKDAANLSKSAANVAKLAAENANSLADDARSDANAAQLLATSHKNTADNARSDANAANTLAQSHKDAADNARSDAVVAQVSAQDAKGLADTAKTNAQNAASDALVSAVSASSSLITVQTSKTSASSALSSILVSETSASTSLIAVQLSKTTASSALSTTLTHRTSALNASISASNAASDALVSKLSASSTLIDITTTKATASSSLVTTQQHESNALSAKNSASSAASGALVSEAAANSTKGRIDTIENSASNSLVTTQSYESNALSAKNSASSAASGALVSEAAANSTKGRIDTIENSASNSLVTTQSYETLSLSARTVANNAASNALVSETASNATKGRIDTIENSASNSLVTTQSYESNALSAKNSASSAASGALVSEAAANSTKGRIDTIENTASNSLVTTQSYESTALSARNSASSAASGALVSEAAANSTKGRIDTIENTASNSLVTIQSNETLSLSAKTVSDNAASNALVSEAAANSTKGRIDTIENTASNTLVTIQSNETLALSAKTVANNAASNALVSEAAANSTKGRIDTIENTASNSLVTTQSYESTALSARNSASSAASGALVSEAAANSTKGRIDTIENTASNSLVTTQSYESTALSARNSASSAASGALVSEASANSTKGRIDTIENSASNSLVTTQSYESTALSARNSASSAASGALVSEAAANSTKGRIDTIENSASNSLVTTQSYESTALSARNSASSAASGALVSEAAANSTKGRIDTIENSASNSLVTTQSYESTALSARNSASSAASGALVSEAAANSTKGRIDIIENSASNSLVTTQSYESTALSARNSASSAASGALVSEAAANSTKGRIDTIENTASNSLVTTQSYESTALSARNSASSAASGALVSEAAANSTKGRIDTIENTASNSLVTTQSYESTALSARNSASSAASGALVSEAAANSTKGRIDIIENSASNSLVTTTGYESNALNSRNSASNAAAGAISSEASASDLLVTITSAKTTASGAAVTATQSKNTAVDAKTNAENAASDAAVSKASASNLLVSVLSAKTTASSSAATTLQHQQSALNSSNAASDNAAATLLSKQSAETTASDIGALTSQIASVRLLDARVTNGMNGHYAGNYWYLDDIGSGSGEGSAMVTPLTNGGAITLQKVPKDGRRELITNGTFDTDLTGWTQGDGQDATVTNAALDLDPNNDGVGTVWQQFSVKKNTDYTLSFDLLGGTFTDDNSNNDAYVLVGTHPQDTNGPVAYSTNTLFSAVPGYIPFGTSASSYSTTFNSGSHSALYLVFLLATNLNIEAQFDNVSIKPVVEAPKTITTTSEALTNYPIASSTGLSGAGQYRVSSIGPIIVTQPTGKMAVPGNFSDERLGLFNTRDFPITATLFSPFNDATVDVYAKVDSTGAAGIFTEGVTPVNHSFTIGKGEYYSWSSGNIAGLYSSPSTANDNDEMAVVFRADTKILGTSNATGGIDHMPLTPMTNSEILSTDYGSEYKYPRIISGGGINLDSLKFAILEWGNNLVYDASNLYLRLADSNGSHRYADINKDNFVDSTDANLIQSYAANSSSVTTEQRTRIEQLIDHLNNNYSSLETTFPSSGTTYTLYDAAPETDTSICSRTSAGAAYHTVDKIRNHVLISGAADGSGADAEVGLPRQALSDYYVLPRTTLTHYRLTTVEPNDIIVSDSNGTVLRTHDLRLASTDNPLSASSNTAASGNGIDIGSGNGPYTFVGTKPFYLVCQSSNDDEVTMFGALQGVLNGSVPQSAVAEEIGIVSSRVDNNVTTITQQTSSIGGLQGQFSVKINNNGFTSGFGLASTNNSAATSAFVVQADRFAIVDPDSYNKDFTLSPSSLNVPFEISGGLTKIRNAFVKDLNASSINAGAITGDKIRSNSKIEVYSDSDKTNTYAALDGSDPLYRLYVGNQDPSLANFNVTTAGDVKLSSLTMDGFDGTYFDSRKGMGLAALAQIDRFISSGRIATEVTVTTGDFDTNTPSTYQTITLGETSDVFQQYKLDARDFSKIVSEPFVSKPGTPWRLALAPERLLLTAAQNLDASTLRGPRAIDDGDGFVYDVVLDRALKRGEVVRVDVGDLLDSGSTMTWPGMSDYNTGTSFNQTLIGPGTIYNHDILCKVEVSGVSNTLTITRPGKGTITWTPYANTTARPAPGSDGKAALPHTIKLTPKISGNLAFMADATDYDANGARVFTRIEENDSFTDTVTQYRVVEVEEGVSYGFITGGAHIDTRPSVETGAVSADGYFEAYTTDVQTGANALDKGTYKYGSDLVCLNSSGNSYTEGNAFEASVRRIIESEMLAEYSEFYVEPEPQVKIKAQGILDSSEAGGATTYSAIKATIRTGNASNGTAYGLNFTGESFLMIENDHRDHEGTGNTSHTKYRQALFLGNTSGAATNTNKENVFVVAQTDSTAIKDYTYSPLFTVDAAGSISSRNVTTNSLTFKDGSTQTTARMAPYFHVSAVPEHNKTLPSEFKTQYDNGTLLGEFNYYSDGFIWQGINEMQLSNENSVMYSMFVKNKNVNAVTKTMKIANLDDRVYIYVNGGLSDSRVTGVAEAHNWVDIDIVIEGANAGNGSGVSRIDIVKNDSGGGSDKFELIGIIIDDHVGGDISWQPFNSTFTYWTMTGN